MPYVERVVPPRPALSIPRGGHEAPGPGPTEGHLFRGRCELDPLLAGIERGSRLRPRNAARDPLGTNKKGSGGAFALHRFRLVG